MSGKKARGRGDWAARDASRVTSRDKYSLVPLGAISEEESFTKKMATLLQSIFLRLSKPSTETSCGRKPSGALTWRKLP